MLEILNRPHPYATRSVRYWLRLDALSSLLVSFLVFFIFSVQNEANIGIPLVWNCLLFGLVTFIYVSVPTIVMPAILPKYFSEDTWTIGKNIFIWAVMVLIASLCNMFLVCWLCGVSLSVTEFSRFFYYTAGLSVVLYIFISRNNYKHLLQKHTEEAGLMNRELQAVAVQRAIGNSASSAEKILIKSENDKEDAWFSMSELLYIESADNYCKFVTFKNGKVHEEVIRTSLKRLEETEAHDKLFRCHRSYMANILKISSVTGNAHGYRLLFEGMDKTIPVSRNAGKLLLEKLKEIKSL